MKEKAVTVKMVQQFWFGEVFLEDLLKAYGVYDDAKLRKPVESILMKSRRDFKDGWTFFTREDIDRDVRSRIARLGKKNGAKGMNG